MEGNSSYMFQAELACKPHHSGHVVETLTSCDSQGFCGNLQQESIWVFILKFSAEADLSSIPQHQMCSRL